MFILKGEEGLVCGSEEVFEMDEIECKETHNKQKFTSRLY